PYATRFRSTLDVGTNSYEASAKTLRYGAEDGTPTTIPLNETGLEYDAATGVLTYTNSLGAEQTVDLRALVVAEETPTTLEYDADGHALTYTGEDGIPRTLTLDVGTISYEASTNTLSYGAEDGTPTPIPPNETGLEYDAATGVPKNGRAPRRGTAQGQGGREI